MFFLNVVAFFLVGCVLLSFATFCIYISLSTAPPHLLWFTVFASVKTTAPSKIFFFIEVFSTINTKLGVYIIVFSSCFKLINLFFEWISFLLNLKNFLLKNNDFILRNSLGLSRFFLLHIKLSHFISEYLCLTFFFFFQLHKTLLDIQYTVV